MGRYLENDIDSLKSVSISTCSSKAKDETPKTNWTALCFAFLILYISGLQMSLYFTSMWPYLLKLDPNAKLPFFGVILASFSVGQAIGSPIFGTWTQKTEAFKVPVSTGLVFCCVGNIIYGILPTIDWQVGWLMLVSRLLIGFGNGNLSAVRAYVCACSTMEDRNKAISISASCLVTGQLTGPILQSAFAFIGDGVRLFNTFDLDAYTTPAFTLSLLLVAMIFFVFNYFGNDYAGIIDKKRVNTEVIIPPFDRKAAFVCLFFWFTSQSIAVNVESLCSIFTIAMYNWTSHQAVVYSGYIQTAACAVSVSQYILMAFTRVGQIDRRIQMLFGCAAFATYYLVVLPYPFYPKTLVFNPNVTDGACTFEWCNYVPKIPFIAYIFVYIICFGVAFPYLGNAIANLYTGIIGPRQQGNMQGVYAFVGSCGRFMAPLATTTLFNASGYTWISVEMLILLAIGALLTFVFWRNLVPIRLIHIENNDKV